MAYYKMVIQPGENVNFVGQLHWLIYGKAIVISVAIATFGGIVIYFASELTLIVLTLVLLSLISFIPP